MPFYEYRCPDGDTTEIMSSMSARPDTVACEVCGVPAKLVPSLTSFSIKGANPDHAVERFPNYNRGLGVEVTSPAHKRAVMKAQGVVEASRADVRDAAISAGSAQARHFAPKSRDVERMADVNEHKAVLDSDWYRDMEKQALNEALSGALSEARQSSDPVVAARAAATPSISNVTIERSPLCPT